MGMLFKGAGQGRAGGAGFAALALLRAYWEGLRPGGTGIPCRASVDPRGLAPALDRVFLAERIAGGEMRLRIAGATLADLAGCPMHGVPLSLLFAPSARPALAGACQGLFDTPAVVEIAAEAPRGIGRPALSARLLMLPLLAQDGALRLALGCLAPEGGTTGRAPRHFAIAQVACQPLGSEAAPAPPETQAAPPEAQAAPPEAQAATVQVFPGRGHLRLVHSA